MCIQKKITETPFKEIRFRKVENLKEYEELKDEIEDIIKVNDQINYDKLTELQIDLQNEIEDMEYAKEQSLSINLPCAIMVPSVVLSVLASYLLGVNKCGALDVVLVLILLIVFLCILVERSCDILKVRRNNLLFRNTIKKILERVILIEYEKNKK